MEEEKKPEGCCPKCWDMYGKAVKLVSKHNPPTRECPDCGAVVNDS